MSFYLDASFMVALQLPETNTDISDRFTVTAEASLFLSEFGAGEVSAAITRQARMRRLTPEEAEMAFFNFDEWRNGATELAEVETADLKLAERLVRDVHSGLRMPDALHIAMAMRRGFTLVTFDEGMARAARNLDVDVVMPGEPEQL